MDKMRQEVKDKIGYWKKMCVLCCLLCGANIWRALIPMEGGEAFGDFFQGFQLGLLIVLTVYSVRNAVKYSKMLADDEAVRAFYIEEHDERIAQIRAKAGGSAMETCALLILMAGIVAGYFNPVVFGTLIVCGVFLLVVRKSLRLYYCKHM